MSTRRARIKAVASLPVRRKNNDIAEAGKSKVELVPSEPLPAAIETQKVPCTTAVPLEVKVTNTNLTALSPIVKPPAENFASPRRSQRAVVTPNLIERSPLTPKLRRPVTPRLPTSPKNDIKTSITSKRSPVVVPNPTTINCDNQPESLASQDEPSIIVSAYKNKPIETPEASKSDYNPPSIPESVTENPVIDGIIPLQSQSASKPKPLDLWKNEIISENAEVLFDPIVPLPSPSKVRPKLRPVPRLPLRRNSVQGSASESEEESRRALLGGSASTTPGPRQRHDSQTLPNMFLNKDISRVRTDSITSTTSHVTAQTPALTAASPLKEKQKIRRSEINRKMQALRRKQRRDMPVSRDALTMYDLIFYNPLNNPIVHDDNQSTTLPEPTEQPEPDKTTDNIQNTDPDDPPPAPEEAAPVPQIKLGPNGEIMLDEQSLVIKQTEPDRALSKSVVHESEWANSGRGKYNRSKRSADWSDVETVRFYRALAAVGTDFTLMAPMFPSRTRKELKVKFKKEERVNGAQIDKALRSQTQWDAMYLQEEFAKERKLAAEMEEKARLEYNQQKQEEKERVRVSRGMRPSRACKAISLDITPGYDDKIAAPLIAQDILNLSQSNLKPMKPRKPRTQRTPISGRRLITKPNEIGNINLIRTPTQPVTKLPHNIESGSLVVLTVNDPKEPSKKMLQTYISNNGQLTPVALPPTLLGSVMDYMKRGTPSTVSASSSPQVPSPGSVASQESRSSVIHINPSPHKKQRHNSYTITQL